jgi:hypothetical protein
MGMHLHDPATIPMARGNPGVGMGVGAGSGGSWWG